MSIFCFLVLNFFLHTVQGHGRLISPVPRFGTGTNYGAENAPVPYGSDEWVCRHDGPVTPVTREITPGGTLDLSWDLSGPHRGDCALYLSYDVGSTRAEQKFFKIANLPKCNEDNEQVVTINVPEWLPAGQVVVRWDWIALHQYPLAEFYSQCYDAMVTGNRSPQSALYTYKINNPDLYPPNSYNTGGDHGVIYRNPFDGSDNQFMVGPPCALGFDQNNCAMTTCGTTGYIDPMALNGHGTCSCDVVPEGTEEPTFSPSAAPVDPTFAPTAAPVPTFMPTNVPTTEPTTSQEPTNAPTYSPETSIPTFAPSEAPSPAPTRTSAFREVHFLNDFEDLVGEENLDEFLTACTDAIRNMFDESTTSCVHAWEAIFDTMIVRIQDYCGTECDTLTRDENHLLNYGLNVAGFGQLYTEETGTPSPTFTPTMTETPTASTTPAPTVPCASQTVNVEIAVWMGGTVDWSITMESVTIVEEGEPEPPACHAQDTVEYYGPEEGEAPIPYEETCCLPGGQYVLTCRATFDWEDSSVSVNGQEYCRGLNEEMQTHVIHLNGPAHDPEPIVTDDNINNIISDSAAPGVLSLFSMILAILFALL